MTPRLYPCKWPLVLVAALVAACATNPVTGKRQLALISEAQELEIGRTTAAEVRATLGLVDAPELQRYVQRIGVMLARTSHRPELPWSFAVVDDPTPNAFALPGGYIFFTRGMMSLMTSEAELASVLGHEIGHVTARHSVTAISRQQLAAIGLGVGGIFFPAAQPFGDALGAGLGLLFLKHGRDAERQADDLGLQYAVAQDYAPSEMADVFRALQRAGDDQRSPLPSWLATHPEPAERIERVEQQIPKLAASGSRVGQAEYMERIDGLVYGHNPRHGFFREGVFYHPDLRFRFDVPTDWQTQNLTDSVVAVSRAQDAAFQLTLAREGDPTTATRVFFAQQGVQALSSSRETINGLPAVVTLFDAATQQGIVRGVVAHIAHGGRIYQLVGYTPQPRFAGYERVFARILGSFATLTDPAILGVQPNRIQVVRLPEAMTLEAFSRRYESAIPLTELALINHAAGPETRFPAGSLLKRVRPS
jgi:predicted Zn-dependent protease